MKSITLTEAIYFVGGFEKVNGFNIRFSPQDKISPSLSEIPRLLTKILFIVPVIC